MKAVACRTDSPIVRYQVYCVIFAWRTGSHRASGRGMTTVNSWMMMLAVMGMMPSSEAQLQQRTAAEVESGRLGSCLRPGSDRSGSRCSPPRGGNDGADAVDRDEASVNRILLRRSGVRNAAANCDSKDPPRAPTARTSCRYCTEWQG